MSSSSQKILAKPTIRIVTGENKGKTFRLGKPTITVGSAPQCDIVLVGNYVSEIHAVLESDSESNWRLLNRSGFGTLVNETRTEDHSLAPGDAIQIGDQQLLRFDAQVQVIKKAAKGVDNDSDDGQKGSGLAARLRDNPVIGVGLAVYAVALIALGLFLATSGEDPAPTGISHEQIARILERSGQQIRSGELGLNSSPGRLLSDNRDQTFDPAAGFYELLALSGADTSSSEFDSQLESWIDTLEEHFFAAWRLERQGNWIGAVSEYERILLAAPDTRLAVSRAASRRIKTLRDRYVND